MFCLNAHNLIIVFNNIKNYSNYTPKYRSSKDIVKSVRHLPMPDTKINRIIIK